MNFYIKFTGVVILIIFLVILAALLMPSANAEEIPQYTTEEGAARRDALREELREYLYALQNDLCFDAVLVKQSNPLPRCTEEKTRQEKKHVNHR